MPYEKPWKSFEQQIEILKSRNMAFDDESKALLFLEKVGYYRLSAYWYPFRKYKLVQNKKLGRLDYIKLDEFEDETAFIDAARLYLFDKKLRLLVLDALERIEVAIRVDVAHLLGKQDTFAHISGSCLHPSFMRKKNAFVNWQDKYQKLVTESREDFVKHYHENHGEDLPIWVACEVWDFGALSKLFAMMKVADQQDICEKYGLPRSEWKTFQSWLRSLNYLRNLCAHHSRLWNRNMDVQPQLPDYGVLPWCDIFIGKTDLIARAFLPLAITKHFVEVICPDTEWSFRLKEHLNAFPGLKSSKEQGVNDLGSPDEWQAWWN